jgi:hypothetical protein
MVTTPGSGSPPQAHPPPPLPGDPGISNALSNYLSQFSLWCRQGFAVKMNSNVALNGILLQANDAPPGQAPAVWLLQVQTNGSFVATPVPLAGGNPTR